jgi:uncharacterized protein with von Willebrand factor type A (vWA) domain
MKIQLFRRHVRVEEITESTVYDSDSLRTVHIKTASGTRYQVHTRKLPNRWVETIFRIDENSGKNIRMTVLEVGEESDYESFIETGLQESVEGRTARLRKPETQATPS